MQEKISKLFRGIFELIKKPSLINHVINEDERWKKYVVRKYGLVSGLQSISLNRIINQDNYNLDVYSFLGGGSMVTDLILLKYLAQKASNGHYLEIGSWRGESLANVAPYIKEAVSMNLSSDEMKKLGLSDDYINQHFILCKHLSNIKYIRANSLTFDWKKLDQKFDVIFVDGDHHYEAVKSDTRNVFSKLRDKESVVVWHDYGNSPENVRWEVLAAILDGTSKENQGKLYHVQNTMCAIYCNKFHDSIDSDLQNEFIKTYSVRVTLNGKS